MKKISPMSMVKKDPFWWPAGVVFILVFGLLLLQSCKTKAPAPVPSPEPPAVVVPPVSQPVVVRLQLSWEIPEKPERSIWSEELWNQIDASKRTFDTATDVTNICPKYRSISTMQQTKALAEIMIGVIYYESGYSPTSWMTENGLGVDPITHKQVKSEGLFQLSYQDIEGYPFCQLDWSKDKDLAQDDPNKTIFDPIINIDCGVKILAIQVSKHKVFGYDSSYWSTLRPDGKYGKVQSITARVKDRAPFCY